MTVLTNYDMFDATVPSNIPNDAAYVAGYVDGAWPWMRTQPALFPNARKLTIAVFATSRARCLDVESGNATPAQAPGWVTQERAAGEDPWVYCSQFGNYGWQAVQNAFNAAKVAHPHYFIAAYNGTRTLPVLNGITAIAHQYVDTGPYDLSSLSDTAIALLGGTVTTQDDMKAVLSGDWRFDNRNPVDMWRQTVATGFAIQASLAALAGTLSTQDAAILAAVQGADADTKAGVAHLATAIASVSAGPAADVTALVSTLAGPLATALGPLLPPEMSPAQFIHLLAAELPAA
jgi:hypothetical protein